MLHIFNFILLVSLSHFFAMSSMKLANFLLLVLIDWIKRYQFVKERHRASSLHDKFVSDFLLQFVMVVRLDNCIKKSQDF